MLRKGLTLVELLIVVLILGALATIAIPRIAASAVNARRRACDANVERLNSQIELFECETGAWPTDLTEITENTAYFGGENVACPFGLPYELDNDRHRVIFHDHTATLAPAGDENEDNGPEAGGTGTQSSPQNGGPGRRRGHRNRGRAN
ncbi:MAG TPA: prepilin-type N-terminal cleavage/methylation domain-containing protein [Anaerohalosphaeraceae bacterium]|jgi:competence protein ComGC|nr:prepilin-type N-terminal cleavage/methylation domain-containing protein [Anaerohalosphaeraceae bacterium]HRT51097.1 prepilin-type N-terminal cleavage/methylation domain-containing protein [Anaerohalosphaeraceae bacterium]HRT87112.1 prepilin-type N-terminal cleavage/methylation domain-containing protein [Anaerohalosphaeraceae bacterium]